MFSECAAPISVSLEHEHEPCTHLVVRIGVASDRLVRRPGQCHLPVTAAPNDLFFCRRSGQRITEKTEEAKDACQ